MPSNAQGYPLRVRLNANLGPVSKIGPLLHATVPAHDPRGIVRSESSEGAVWEPTQIGELVSKRTPGDMP